MLAVASSPAQASPPNVAVNVANNLPSGGTTTLRYTVTNTNPNVPGAPNQANITLSLNGLRCTGECGRGVPIPAGQSRDFTAQLTAPQVASGQTQSVQLQIRAEIGNEADNQQQTITVRGADKPQTVRQVTGRVKDVDGKPVPGANVGVQDSQNHKQITISNNDGRFQFTSTDAQPILAGNISVAVIKDGYKSQSVSVQGGVGKTINVPLTLEPTEAAAATPSPTAAASTPAADEASDPATDVASQPATDPQNAANSGGSSSMLFIILGVLLVAAGIGAIVLVVMRRKNGGDDPNDPDGPGGVMPTGGGRYHGGADPTRIAAPVGGRAPDATMIAGRSRPSTADAPTMMQQAVPIEDEFPDPYGAPVVPHGGYAGAGGYGTAAAGTYGAAPAYGAGAYGGAQVPAQAGGYEPGPPTQYGRPPDPEDDPYGTYGPPQNGADGYGGEPRYDEPTGMYRPESNGGYSGGPDQGYGTAGYRDDAYGREPEYPPAGRAGRGETSGAYQAGAYSGAGYGQEQPPDQGGYGAWNPPAGGIDSGNAYGPPAGGGTYGGGNYGGSPAGGSYAGGSYGAPTGGGPYGRPDDAPADQGGYDPRATYGRPESYDRGQPSAPGYSTGDQGGYGDDQYGAGQGGYYSGGEQGGGRHGGQSRQQPQESSHPGQRRPLDWLDD